MFILINTDALHGYFYSQLFTHTYNMIIDQYIVETVYGEYFYDGLDSIDKNYL